MKKQFLTLSVIAALAACESSDDEETSSGVSTPTPAEFSGDASGVTTKAENAAGTLSVNDVNSGESLIYPAEADGTYGSFEINAAGEWQYTLYRGAADSDSPEHPDVTALVKAGLPDLAESFTVKSADGTEQVISIVIRGIDVPASFSGDIANKLVQRDTDKGNAEGTISVSDGNPEEASFTTLTEEQKTITTSYGVATFDPKTGDWTYDLDEDNDEVIALNSTSVSMTDSFTITSLDGTEQAVTITILGSDPVAATFTPFSNMTTNEDGTFAAEMSVDDVTFTSSLSVTDPNYQEAAMIAADEIAAQYGSVMVDDKGVWTYSIDYTADGISGLYYTEATDTPPTLSDSFTLTSADGTEATVAVTLQGAQLVPAVISGYPVLDDDGISSSAVNATVTSVTGSLSIADANYGQSEFDAETLTTTYGSLTISANGDWTYELSDDTIAQLGSNSLTLPLSDDALVTSVDGTTQSIEVSIVALEAGNYGVQVGDSDGSDAKWVIDMPADTSATGKASFVARFPENSTKDAKLVFHGSTYKPTELHRTLLALTVRANGELRLNNETGNGKYHVLDQTVVKGTPFKVDVTWDASAGTPAQVTLKIDGTLITSSAMTFNGDGSFTSMSVGGGLQTNGPDFFEIQTKGGNSFDIDDFKVYSDVAGTTEIFNEAFDADDIFEGSTITLDYQNSNTKSNSTAVGVAFPPNLAAHLGGNGSDAKWVIDMPEATSATGKATFNLIYPDSSTKDAKFVFHGSAYKPTELHRTLLALTVRANGELRLNNETGNGKYHVLDQTAEKGKPVAIAVTWDASAGTPAIMSLTINGTPVTSSAMTFISDGTFDSMTVGAGLQTNGPDFFEVQTKGGSPVIIDDFIVYGDVAGTTEIFNEDFNDQTQDVEISLDYESDNSNAASVATAVLFENP